MSDQRRTAGDSQIGKDGKTGKTRVIILGAGPAGLAAAFGLSDSPELRARYEVTVYQAGWRAGGKCSTGRREHSNRIEQNCTHYLFGCYQNTFSVIRRAYQELNDAGEDDFGRFEETLLPRDLVVLKQFFNGNWHDWAFTFPRNASRPGDGGELPTPSDYIGMTLRWLAEMIFGWRLIHALDSRYAMSEQPEWWHRSVGRIERGLAGSFDHAAAGLLDAVLRLAGALGEPGGTPREDAGKTISWALKKIRGWLWAVLKDRVDTELRARRRWILLDYACTTLIGMLDDEVLGPDGFAAIDDYDFRDWLERHGATEQTRYSPIVALWYENSLAFRGGDMRYPDLSAAIALLGQLRASFTYKGSVAYSLQSEIGDSFIAPLYQALRNRGVRFRFFHRIWELQPHGADIARITVERQVELASGDPDDYQPLLRIGGRRYWPNRPLSAQFAAHEREKFEQCDENLESFYTAWRGAMHTLELGRDYDAVVFALPVAAIPFYCSQILQQRPSWRELVEHHPSVESQALWLWLRPDLSELGWTKPVPILSSYAPPYCTWEDDSQLSAQETVADRDRAQTIACVFGPLAAPEQPPGPQETDYPRRQQAAARQAAERFLERDAGPLWPGSGTARDPLALNRELLIASSSRANCGPLERYTMTWSGSLRYRLKTDESGYRNLFLAGDWVRNGLEAGSIEGAMMAGLQASRAICGHPVQVVGEFDSFA